MRQGDGEICGGGGIETGGEVELRGEQLIDLKA